MGLAFTIDTPYKVAHFGISSALSVIEDQLLEKMREILCEKENRPFVPVHQSNADHRAQRITTYLDLLADLVQENTARLSKEDFIPGNSICKYFEMLPAASHIKTVFEELWHLSGTQREETEKVLRSTIKAGAIDVNIMTKVDRTNFDSAGNELPPEYSDAMSALRGFANSKLTSSVIFSAGLNPRLYSYCENFTDFFPSKNTPAKKKIIIKVSDYRSALIQGKFLAKKGLWVTEFRIESGLNCGGHAFATEGLLLGPILAEFRDKRTELVMELYTIYREALEKKGIQNTEMPQQKTTVQGGIGTGHENEFLLQHYKLDATGWGSPFLLVPEATSVDEKTLTDLSEAIPSDYYLSNASPLGIPFNNFRKSTSEAQRKLRISKNRPGSPCYKKFLAFNTEFSEKSICTASREYQDQKIKQLNSSGKSESEIAILTEEITEKDCLCEGLGASAILANNKKPAHKLSAVTICPGPNLAYFSGISSLRQMVDHIYGRTNILNNVPRPHLFINELSLYIKYLGNEISKAGSALSEKQIRSFNNFRANLLSGISYYEELVPLMQKFTAVRDQMRSQLQACRESLYALFPKATTGELTW